ncbi:MAG TPA: glycosyltransferase family 2 protein [Stellaceae bacterium]|nr:glycosyltransferase family 2 protein [Stellaceae bacterium]
MTEPSASLVSVVISSFNYAQFIGAAIDSALGQSYPNVEIIVVDDGSTDASRAVIAGYGDRVRAVFKANGGNASSINAGFAAARGDIVLFMDADDLLLPQAIERMVAAMRPGASAVQVPVMNVDAAGRPLGSVLPVLPKVWTPERIRRTVLRTGSYPYPPTSGNAYPRWFLERVMPMRAEYGGIDGILNCAAALHGDVVVLREPLVCYRFHGRNMGAASEIRPEKLHYYVSLDLPRNAFLVEEARRLGIALSPRRVERAFYFAQYRLVSRKLRPDLHPLRDDTLLRVTARFLEAAAVAPDRPLRRLAVALWGLAVALSPLSLAEPLVTLRFSSMKRPRALESFFQMLGLVRRMSGKQGAG